MRSRVTAAPSPRHHPPGTSESESRCRIGEGGGMEFYDAVSQVIPVLVVALVADAGRFGRKAGTSGSFILAIMLGIVGESTALAAIQRGHGNTLMLYTVWLSMAWMAAILLWPHVNEQGQVVR